MSPPCNLHAQCVAKSDALCCWLTAYLLALRTYGSYWLHLMTQPKTRNIFGVLWRTHEECVVIVSEVVRTGYLGRVTCTRVLKANSISPEIVVQGPDMEEKLKEFLPSWGFDSCRTIPQD
ncbi:hypothetical protein M0804_000274 [Polistes exclamans]|nr:hypothetical protein M0804_000274 [Polistes exclamans]